MLIWLPIFQSRCLLYLCWLQNGCAAFALWYIDWPVALRVAALLGIFLYGRRRATLPAAILFEPNRTQLIFAEQRIVAHLGAQCYCSEFLIVLCLHLDQGALEEVGCCRAGGTTRWILLLPDSSDADALRRLRVMLRWHVQRPNF